MPRAQPLRGAGAPAQSPLPGARPPPPRPTGILLPAVCPPRRHLRLLPRGDFRLPRGGRTSTLPPRPPTRRTGARPPHPSRRTKGSRCRAVRDRWRRWRHLCRRHAPPRYPRKRARPRQRASRRGAADTSEAGQFGVGAARWRWEWGDVPRAPSMHARCQVAWHSVTRRDGVPDERAERAQSPQGAGGASSSSSSSSSALPWHCLNFLPEPHGQGSLRPTLAWARFTGRAGIEACSRSAASASPTS